MNDPVARVLLALCTLNIVVGVGNVIMARLVEGPDATGQLFGGAMILLGIAGITLVMKGNLTK